MNSGDFQPLLDRQRNSSDFQLLLDPQENSNDFQSLLDRQGLAKYLGLASGTLAVWDCTKRYDLEPIKIGRAIFYSWANIYKFISIDEHDLQELINSKDVEPLMNRKQAAKYINSSPGTLAIWDFTKRYDLKPRKVGGAIRYRKADLDKFKELRLHP